MDGRTVPQLEGTIATARGQGKNGVFVMDGGASRAAVDDLLVSVSDLVILPFTADDDFNYVVTEEMRRFPEALAMPSNWTTNSKAADVDAGYIEKLEALYPGRILPPTPNTHSVRDFLLQNFNGKVLPPAQRYCRTLARRIADILDAEGEDERSRAGDTPGQRKGRCVDHTAPAPIFCRQSQASPFDCPTTLAPVWGFEDPQTFCCHKHPESARGLALSHGTKRSAVP